MNILEFYRNVNFEFRIVNIVILGLLIFTFGTFIRYVIQDLFREAYTLKMVTESIAGLRHKRVTQWMILKNILKRTVPLIMFEVYIAIVVSSCLILLSYYNLMKLFDMDLVLSLSNLFSVICKIPLYSFTIELGIFLPQLILVAYFCSIEVEHNVKKDKKHFFNMINNLKKAKESLKSLENNQLWLKVYLSGMEYNVKFKIMKRICMFSFTLGFITTLLKLIKFIFHLLFI